MKDIIMKYTNSVAIGNNNYYSDESKNGFEASYNYQLDTQINLTDEITYFNRIRGGNMQTLGSDDDYTTSLFALEEGFDSGNAVQINRNYFKLDVCEGTQLFAGPSIRQDDMLPNIYTYYDANLYDQFSYQGINNTLILSLGAGAGFIQKLSEGINFSVNIIGINKGQNLMGSTFLSYEGEDSNNCYKASLSYTYYDGGDFTYQYGSEEAEVTMKLDTPKNNFGINFGIKPKESTLCENLSLESVSLGAGLTHVNEVPVDESNYLATYFAGLNWHGFSDNDKIYTAVSLPIDHTTADNKAVMTELAYDLHIYDNIGITFGISYLINDYFGKNSTAWVIRPKFNFEKTL